MKKKLERGRTHVLWLKKLWLMMRLCVLLILLASVSVTATVYSQNSKLTLKMKNSRIADVFNSIEEQSDYYFFYNRDLFDDSQMVSVDMENKNVSEILDELFKGRNISYKIVERNILIEVNADKLNQMNQQKGDIRGKVTDSSGAPLPGVTVLIKGTTQGTITDGDGNYSLPNVPGDGTLVFSFVGMRTQEIGIAGKTQINITLEELSIGLDEVVAVGYGTQRKITITGSVVNTKGDELMKSPVPNVTNSIQGRLPGVIAVNTSGEPGRDDSQILIRGRSTFGNTQPLLVIDGVPRPTEGLGRIDPQSIESITVLKDASAAIYGARAANGVILVQTKRGDIGKPVFNFNYNQGFSQPTRVLDVLDAATYAEVRNEADIRNGASSTTYTEEDIQKFRDGSDPIMHPNTDWVAETLKSWTLQNKMNLSVNGGSKTIRYFLSLGLQNQDGHFKNNPTDYKQYNLRSNIDANITDNFKVSLNVAGRLEKRTYPSTGTWVNFVNILSAPPRLPAKYPNGLIAAGRFGENPLLRDQAGYLKQESMPIQSTLAIEYKVPFIEGLSFNGSYSYDFTHDFEKTFQKPYSYWEYVPITDDYIEVQSNYYASPAVRDYFNRSFVTTYNLTASYVKSIGRHNISLMLGAERAENKGNNASAFRKNFPSTSLTDINFGGSGLADQSTSGSSYLTRRDNYFGRASYNFQEKYLAEFLFRYDGSPIFPKNKRYGFFPGFSVGWRISEEDFMKSLTALDYLKLRASYGELGNDDVDDPYAYLSSYSIGRTYNFGGIDVLGLNPGVLPNSNYTWEVLETMNFGADASFWDLKLGVELDIFKQNRSSILAQRQLSVSDTYGYSGLPPENIGKVENHGFELVLSHNNRFNDLIFRARGNVSFARNKYVYFDEVPAGEEYQMQTGRPIGAPLIWGTAGIYKTQEEIDNSVHLANAKPGDLIYVDKNRDGNINNDDQYRMDKSSIPEIVFGLDLNFEYKNLDLTLFFQGQGNAVYFPGITSLGGESNAAAIRAKDRWTIDNTDGTMPRSGGNFAQFSEFNMYSAAFVRLKNLELGYTFPERLTSKIGISDFRVYTNAFNVFTISEIDFMDPEGRGDGSDPNSTRTDANYYPQLRVFNLGVSLSF
ncbi:TonB-dependent receptor [Gaoshiqia sediminis]|uniref:TonB-dependent receptor n=1 Tax=Gaoshiqia sediminis TaxID=2986998 RepID=A0AA41Y0Q4_9BACT|nr:TonB-dependent receptor [Gaoshiqia sediminis]MCW0481319.1 TonB-dependent receptor [Gaoshiqia sediminis]